MIKLIWTVILGLYWHNLVSGLVLRFSWLSQQSFVLFLDSNEGKFVGKVQNIRWRNLSYCSVSAVKCWWNSGCSFFVTIFCMASGVTITATLSQCLGLDWNKISVQRLCGVRPVIYFLTEQDPSSFRESCLRNHTFKMLVQNQGDLMPNRDHHFKAVFR